MALWWTLALTCSCLPPMLIRVVMFGCIMTGCLCSIVSVLSRGSLLYISCGLSAVEINKELLLLFKNLLLLSPTHSRCTPIRGDEWRQHCCIHYWLYSCLNCMSQTKSALTDTRKTKTKTKTRRQHHCYNAGLRSHYSGSGRKDYWQRRCTTELISNPYQAKTDIISSISKTDCPAKKHCKVQTTVVMCGYCMWQQMHK